MRITVTLIQLASYFQKTKWLGTKEKEGPDKQRCLTQTQNQLGSHLCYNYQHSALPHPSLQAKDSVRLQLLPSSMFLQFFGPPQVNKPTLAVITFSF